MKNLNPYLRYINKTSYLPNKNFVIAYDCRFFFVLSGTGEFLTENDKFRLKENTLVYYPSGVPYFIKSDQDNPLNFVTVNFDFTRNLEEIKNTLRPVKLCDFEKEKERPTQLEIDEEIFRFVLLIKNAYFVREDLESLSGFFRKDEVYSFELCHSILRCIILKIVINSLKSEKKNGVIEDTISFIKNNYDKEINVKTIANSIGYHPYYLSSLFKKHLGKTLSEYLSKVRLDCSIEYLLHTDISIKEIAYKCGFINAEHFSSKFKKAYGVSPLNYRKNNSII